LATTEGDWMHIYTKVEKRKKSWFIGFVGSLDVPYKFALDLHHWKTDRALYVEYRDVPFEGYVLIWSTIRPRTGKLASQKKFLKQVAHHRGTK
jgi:hypothetical protein